MFGAVLVAALAELKSDCNIMKEYTNSQIAALIDDYIHSARDREILKARLIDGICFEPLAEMFDLSVRQVKRIVYKNQNILFSQIKL